MKAFSVKNIHLTFVYLISDKIESDAINNHRILYYLNYPKPSFLAPPQGICFKSIGNETSRDFFFSVFYAFLILAQRVVHGRNTRGPREEYAWSTRGPRELNGPL
jgi:hypothetical protein